MKAAQFSERKRRVMRVEYHPDYSHEGLDPDEGPVPTAQSMLEVFYRASSPAYPESSLVRGCARKAPHCASSTWDTFSLMNHSCCWGLHHPGMPKP